MDVGLTYSSLGCCAPPDERRLRRFGGFATEGVERRAETGHWVGPGAMMLRVLGIEVPIGVMSSRDVGGIGS